MSAQVLGLIFTCPGLDGTGCPNKAKLGIAIGVRRHDGLSFTSLDESVRAQGWALLMSRVPQPSGGELAFAEPGCPACAAKLAERIRGDGQGDPRAVQALDSIIAGAKR